MGDFSRCHLWRVLENIIVNIRQRFCTSFAEDVHVNTYPLFGNAVADL